MLIFHRFKKAFSLKKSATPASQAPTRLSERVKPLFNRPLSFDLSDLKKAIAQANAPEYPDRSLLLNIYDYVMQDSEVFTQYQIAHRMVSAAPYAIFIGDRMDKNLTSFFNAPFMQDVIAAALDASFFGFTLLEVNADKLDELAEDSIITLPRSHYNPVNGRFYIDGDPNGAYINTQDNLHTFSAILVRGEELGLLKQVSFATLPKYYALNDWLRLNEKYGIPPIHISTQTTDPKEVDRLETLASAFGRDMYIITQEGDQVQILDNKAQNFYESFKNLIEYADKQIAKLINGQTGVSDERSYVGASEVHERLMKHFNASRLRSIQNALNATFIPLLQDKGILPALSNFRFISAEEDVNIAPEEAIKEDTPISIEGEKEADEDEDILKSDAPKEVVLSGDVIKKKTLITPYPSFNTLLRRGIYIPEFIEIARFKKIRLEGGGYTNVPDWSELYHGRNLHPAFKRALFRETYKPLREAILSGLDTTIADARLAGERTGTDGGDVYYTPKDITPQESKKSDKERAPKRGKQAPGVQMGKPSAAMMHKLLKHAAVFATFKNHQKAKEVKDALIDPKTKNIRSRNSFLKEVEKIEGKYNKAWLATEYNTALRTARQALKWDNIHEKKHLYPFLRYVESTAKDKRPEHLALVGIVEPIESPFWDTYYPPNGWNCQCSVEALSAIPHDYDKKIPKNPPNVPEQFKADLTRRYKIFNEDMHPYYEVEEEVAEKLTKEGEKEARRLEVKEALDNRDKNIGIPIRIDKNTYKLSASASSYHKLLGNALSTYTGLTYEERNVIMQSENIKTIFKNAVFEAWQDVREGKNNDVLKYLVLRSDFRGIPLRLKFRYYPNKMMTLHWIERLKK